MSGPVDPAVAPTPPDSSGTSIVIVNYHSSTLLEECLCSLFEAGYREEIIVVDNASADGLAGLQLAFPTVRVIHPAENRGFGAGCNLGARHARGRWLVCLNPDTRVACGSIHSLIAALEANGKIGLVTPKILLVDDPSHINACGNDMHYTGLTLCRGLGEPASAYAAAATVSAISGAAFAMRLELFERLGGFDEQFFMYMEDTDLSWRARLLGYQCGYVSDAVVYHHYRLRVEPDKLFYLERNRYRMLLKGLRWRSLAILLPALLLAEAITWGFALLQARTHLAGKWSAYGWTLLHWSALLRARQQTQANRTASDRELIAQCTFRLALEQTGDSRAARLAGRLFEPLFAVWQRAALLLIRW